MANILVYALHYEGAINKNSLGAVSEGAKLAGEIGGEAHAILLGENVPRDLAASLGRYGAKKKPLQAMTASEAGIDAGKVGVENSAAHWTAAKEPPAKAAGEIIEDEDTGETVEKILAWLDERKLI